MDDNVFPENDTVVSKPVRRKKSRRKELWQGHYCCVPDCRNSSARNKECTKQGLDKISFHAFPDIKSAKGKQWIKLIRRDPGSHFDVTKGTKICSAHFVLDDFVSGGKNRCLKKNAVPSIFPWNQRHIKRSSLTSKQTLQPFTSEGRDKPDIYLPTFDADLNVDSVELQYITDSTESTGDLNHTGDSKMGDVGPQSKLAHLERMLSVTRSKLANTENKLADTESKLADAENKLVDAEGKLADTERKLAEPENTLKRSLLRLENIKCNDQLIKLYTGFNDYETLVAFYEEILQSDAKVMRQ